MWRFFLVGLALVGCSNNHKEQQQVTRFFEDGRAKPVVVVTPMVDTTTSDLNWSLSEEFTSMITKGVSAGESVCVLAGEEYGYTENPFTEDLSWMKGEFVDKEFVVFLELVEHELAPVKKEVVVPFETPMNLKMSVRLRMVDLRGQEPRIVLQELVRDRAYIPRTEIPVDYQVVVWGTKDYVASPMGRAHHQLVNEIAQRIKDYLTLAKSR
jgi:hypothetical protein